LNYLFYGDSSVQSGRRPCIIVSNNVANIFSDNLTVVPCTSNIQKSAKQPTHYFTKLYNNTDSVVLCENITTIPKKSCGSFIGLMTEEDMKYIDKCLAIAIGLKEIPKSEMPKVETPKIEKPKVEYIDAVKAALPIQKTDKPTGPKIYSKAKKRKFLEEYEKYGKQYVMTKYNLPSETAVYLRVNRYKKALDSKK
jgi:mRNA interferase MazF